jgi:TetR/AcrR family transcriptional regulator
MDKPKKRPRSKSAARDSAPDTEARILEAARVVFTRAGTAGARMQDIAQEAGVNQALLHYYFRTKEALAMRVLRDAASKILVALPRAIRPDAPLEEVVRTFVGTYIDTMRQTPFLPPYLAAEAHHNPERVLSIMSSIWGGGEDRSAPPVLAIAQQLIDARVAAGEMRPIRAEQFVINVMALLAFPFVARSILGGVLSMDPAAFDRFLDERREDLPRFILNAVRI